MNMMILGTDRGVREFATSRLPTLWEDISFSRPGNEYEIVVVLVT